MSFDRLRAFLPENSFPYVESLLLPHGVTIRISSGGKTRHGSFSFNKKTKSKRINITRSLNPYAFLITLVHEIAHLKCHELYGAKIRPHGIEWKNIFTNLMEPLIADSVFPEDLKTELKRHFLNPKASSSEDLRLNRVLRNYNSNSDSSLVTIEELPDNSRFIWSDGRVFEKKQKLRKRYKCIEPATKRIYSFSPLVQVKPIAN